MISPPVTVWPANTLTPRRFAWKSRPLRLEPRPFLCAMRSAPLLLRADRGDPDPRELLAVARAALVPPLGLELEHAQLRPALVRDDLGLDHRGGEPVALEHGIPVAGQQQRLQRDGGADVVGQPLDEQRLPLDHAVLLAAGLDDCVGHGSAHSVTSASACAFARERPRPPGRPGRRGRRDSAPSSSSASSPASSTTWVTSGSSTGSAARERLRPTGFAAAPGSPDPALARERVRPAGVAAAESSPPGAASPDAGCASVASPSAALTRERRRRAGLAAIPSAPPTVSSPESAAASASPPTATASPSPARL